MNRTRLLGNLGSLFTAKIESIGQSFDGYAARCAREHEKLVGDKALAATKSSGSNRHAFPTTIAVATLCGVFALRATSQKPVHPKPPLNLGKN